MRYQRGYKENNIFFKFLVAPYFLNHKIEIEMLPALRIQSQVS